MILTRVQPPFSYFISREIFGSQKFLKIGTTRISARATVVKAVEKVRKFYKMRLDHDRYVQSFFLHLSSMKVLQGQHSWPCD